MHGTTPACGLPRPVAAVVLDAILPVPCVVADARLLPIRNQDGRPSLRPGAPGGSEEPRRRHTGSMSRRAIALAEHPVRKHPVRTTMVYA